MTAKTSEKVAPKLTKGYRREYYEVACPQCGGSGLIDYEAGLIRLHCRKCKGTGKIRKERRVLKDAPRVIIPVADQATVTNISDGLEAGERKENVDADEGAGSAPPGDAGSTTGESAGQEESKTSG